MRSNVTGAGNHNSEYRSFNRGFGRGHPKPFQRQPSTQPPRKGDIFIEAGRLAVDYLVSNGLLSSNVLSGKYQNGMLRNGSGEFRDNRGSQDRDVISISRGEGRPIGRAGSPDRGLGSRRMPNDEDPRMSRNYSGERRRFGASRSFGSEWSRESGREESFADKFTASQGVEAENDKFLKGKSKDDDADTRNSNLNSPALKDDGHNELQGEMGKSHNVDSDSKVTSSVHDEDGKELPKRFDLVNTQCDELNDGSRNNDAGKETSNNDLDDQNCGEKNDTSSKVGMDLLKLCSSAKIPTRVRSSLANRSPKSDPLLRREEKKDNGSDTMACIKDDTMTSSSGAPSSNEILGSNSVDDHSSKDAHAVTQPMPSESFTDKTFSSEKKSDDLPDPDMCSAIAKERGVKRSFELEDIDEEGKKAKQWLSVARSDDYLPLSDINERQSILPPKRGPSATIVNEFSNQDSFTTMSLPLKGDVESAKEQGQEKQLFANSFKICDLNLMEASDMHENRDMSALMYPSMSAPSKSTLVDIDLSMNNNCSLTNSYNDTGAGRKDIEVIDLESGTMAEGQSINDSARNMEGNINQVGSFQNSSHNSNHNPDGQDGYGFMISELLGNDAPNCSSVQPDMNSLQNEMGVHHGEGIFGEDDPMYMPFGDIPLSLFRAWDQQSQERNPFEM